MSQPSITCGSWMNDLSCLCFQHCALAVPNSTEACPSAEFQYFPGLNQYRNNDVNGFGANEDAAYGLVDEYPDHTAMPVVDSHPNIPLIHLGGTMLVDQFANDPHATHWKKNLYYPFASRADWQLALWLLHSHLSMAAIDKFLFLELVWLGLVQFIKTNLFVRSNNFLYLFDQPGSYAFT